ncbi:MAG: alpha/beta hydrolase [Gammaproteobacteria bacterium]|nr:MAG: alpha/beta hydrolase [Gammaproteobacteria bacterium]
MISLRGRVIRFMTKQFFKRIKPDSDIDKLRIEFEEIGTKLRPAEGVQVRHAKIAGIDCDWLVPEGCDGAPILYYLHGGAYVMGSPKTHRRMVSHIIRRAGMRALLPDYRLAPENQFPASLEDSTNVYRALIEAGTDPERMAIGGDSAGGNLAMATLLALRDAGDPLPATCFLLSPWLDLAAQGETHESRADYDPWFRPEDMSEVVKKYCSEFDLKNPLVSPVYADAANLPPTLIQVGDHEILLSDSTRLADNIEKSGGDVTLQVWPDMWHVFQFFIGQMPESKKAIKGIAEYLQKQFGAQAVVQEPQEDRAA